MNRKTKKRAVAENTTKAVPAMDAKRSLRAAGIRNAGHEPAAQAEPVGRKRRKAFVL